jgi:hypothetical protein
MEDFANRPWGRLTWVADRLDIVPWALYGCIATEERWAAVLELLRERDLLGSARMLEIGVPAGHPQQTLIAELKRKQEERARTLLEPHAIERHDLLEPYGQIVESARQFSGTAKNVMLDITALPKRFFFPIMKRLLLERGIENLVVTYSVAESYASEALHEDSLPPAFLPLFNADGDESEQAFELLLVGLGFDAPGLMQILEMGDVRHVEVMLPYPAAPPFGRRNWEFLRHIWPSIDRHHCRLVETSAIDVPSCYAAICGATASARKRAILAPYGPKPLSLAMCLYAQGIGRATSAVMYTQPKYYHPQYSSGVAKDGAGDVIYAYPVRLAGRDLYQ